MIISMKQHVLTFTHLKIVEMAEEVKYRRTYSNSKESMRIYELYSVIRREQRNIKKFGE